MASLPVISVDGVAPFVPVNTSYPVNVPFDNSASTNGNFSGNSNTSQQDVFATIEKLADLRAKGILSDAEFATKKSELLSRV